MTKRNCDHCKKGYEADERNLKRGWGLTCSKSCAAFMREKSKSGYNPSRVKKNNARRVLWNYHTISSNTISGYTSEGYRIINGIAYNEFDEPMYVINR